MPKPVISRIGASQNYTNIVPIIDTLLANTNDIQDQLNYKNLLENYLEIENEYNTLENKKESYISLRNKIDQLEKKICPYREHWQKYYSNITDKDIME